MDVASVVEVAPDAVSVEVAVSLALPCPDWGEVDEVAVDVDALSIGTMEGLASMMTVLVDVAVRPDWSVAM